MKKRTGILLTCVFALICLVWLYPIFQVAVNSLKTNDAINKTVFDLPNSGTFAGFSNYIKGLTFGNYPFLLSAFYSLFITVSSVFLILLCCSMSAWYIARSGSRFPRRFTICACFL